MQIIPIFTHRLSAFYYDDTETSDEFRRLFNQWNDPEFLMEFFSQNLSDLESGFFGTVTIEDATLRTYQEANNLEKKLRELANKSSGALDAVFEPLDDYQSEDPSKSKARSDFHKSWLRIYAIKIEPGVYIVTGGAIKLTRTMNERPHTANELHRFARCLDYLNEVGITDAEGLKECYL